MKYLLSVLWLALSGVGVAATPPPVVDIPAVLKQAREHQLRFRDGDMEAASDYVALLEKATIAETGNADLWQSMGLAYVYLAARATMAGGNRSDAVIALQKGMPALNRALELDPGQAEALSLRAGMRAMLGLQMNATAQLSQAVADMNRAVALAPKSVAVRLTRVFGGPVMPEALRSRANEAADLDFLIEVAERNRAGDYMTILRADLHFENGETDSARQLYAIVDGTGAASAARLARSRLAMLPQGGETMMKEIKALRAVAGTQCSMCHGRAE